MILLELWPFIFMAVLFFVLSMVAKKSHDNKWNDAIKAKVIEVVEHGRTNGQYTTHSRYDIKIIFQYEGKTRQKTITNQCVQWPVNSIIDVNVYGEYVKILTPIPKNSYFTQMPAGYKILRGIMWFFIGYTLLALMTCNVFTEMFIIPTILVLLSWLFYTIRKKHLHKMSFVYNDDNMVYVNAMVKKILLERSSNNNRYYAVLEYEHNGILHTYDKAVRPVDHNIGDVIQLKCNKHSGEVIEMNDKKDTFINVGCLVGMISCLSISVILVIFGIANLLL